MHLALDPAIACYAEGAPAPAYTTGAPEGTWAAGSLPVTFAVALPVPDALGAAAIAEVAVAARTWSEVSCTAFRASVLPAAQTLAPGDDGVNGIFFHTDAWPPGFVPGALGQTVVTLDAQGNIHDADVHLNFVDHAWSLGTGPADDRIDARGVLLHELGHALGLGHSTDARATMYASHPPGMVWRSLAQDDRDGVCALYPGSGALRCDAGGDPCPAGLVCIGGECERPGTRGVLCAPCARVPGACDGAGDDARCDDLPGGGRVCGRACATDADCGARMTCAPQTASGDRQCAPTDGCASGPDPCAVDADCAPDGVCRGGACVGPGDPPHSDAGTPDDAAGDAGPSPTASGGGCSASAARPGRGAPSFAFALSLVALACAYLRTRRSPTPASRASSRRARRGARPTSS